VSTDGGRFEGGRFVDWSGYYWRAPVAVLNQETDAVWWGDGVGIGDLRL